MRSLIKRKQIVWSTFASELLYYLGMKKNEGGYIFDLYVN